MEEPTSAEEVLEFQDLRRADLWMDVGHPRRALDDLDQVIEIAPTQGAFYARGIVHRQLGDHEAALADFRRGEAIDPQEWKDAGITLLDEADSHARLGDEASALDCCARLPDNFWTPGLDGAPAGGKAEIADELRRIAADARRKRA
jgi:tetratricopeptide (TPR) repeat protein